jgi:hypothetical protein
MSWYRLRELVVIRKRVHDSRGLDSNVIPLGPYRHKAAGQSRWAWWAAVLGLGHRNAPARPVPAVSSGEILRFRKQAGMVRW